MYGSPLNIDLTLKEPRCPLQIIPGGGGNRLLSVGNRLLSVVVVAAVLFGGLSAAEAHDSTTETYEVEVPVYEWVTEPVMSTREVPEFDHVPTEVQVERTREVPVYNFVPTEVQVQRTREVPVYNEFTSPVRIAPFRERVTFQPPCEWATVYGHRVYYCPPPRTRWQVVYNYGTTTRYVLVGTRTETYTATETQMVWTQTGTRTETYTATETQMVWTQTGTRTEIYDTGATRLVKRDTGRTTTVNRTHEVHEGCPDGYYELDSPDTQAWHTSGGGITFERSLFSGGELVSWIGPLNGHPDCYAPDQSGVGWGDVIAGGSKIIIGTTEYAVTAGKVVIDGVTFVVKSKRIVINNAAGIVGTALETTLAQAIQQHLSTFTKAALKDLCTNPLTAATTAALVAVALGAAPITLGTSAVAAGVIAALTTFACIQLKDWYDPPPVEPGPVSGLLLVASDSLIQVSWNAPAKTDTRGFGYDISWKLASEAWTATSSKVRKVSGSTTSYRISGLVNGKTYTVQVTARNDGGESAAVNGTATPSTTSTTTPTTTTTTTTTEKVDLRKYAPLYFSEESKVREDCVNTEYIQGWNLWRAYCPK